MCLIILTDKPSKITKAVCQSAMRKNSDGTGVMWYDAQGNLQVRKWLSTNLKKWWPEWREICAEAEAAQSELAVHWRMATHGDVSIEMCHPYRIESSDTTVQMMHNGIITGYGEKDFTLSWNRGKSAAYSEPAVSDTYEYARMLESILMDGGSKMVENPAFLALLGNDIGTGNKLVFGCEHNPEKTFSVVNPDSGIRYEGHWFSNTYAWDYPRKTTVASSRTYGAYTGNAYSGSTINGYSNVYGNKTRESLDFGFEDDSLGNSRFRADTGIKRKSGSRQYHSVEDVASIFRNNLSEALDALEEVPVPSTRLTKVLEMAMVDRKEAEHLLSKSLYEFAEEYYDTVLAY